MGTLSVSIVEDGVTFQFQEGTDYSYSPARDSVVSHEYLPSPLANIFLEYEPLALETP